MAVALPRTQFERAVFESVYGLPDTMRPVFLFITQFGSPWMILVVVAGITSMRKYVASLQLIAAAGISSLLVVLLKDYIARPRPYDLWPEVLQKELYIGGQGFPSGHTALVAAVSVVLWPLVPWKFRWALVVLCVGVAFSRLYLGVHAPLDIVGGAGIGLISGAVAQLYIRKRKNPKS